MAKLIIVRGIPGSGKSTYAKNLMKLLGTEPEHFEADMFFGKEYKFDYKYLSDAHKWCQAQTAFALFNNKDVIVSNTFIKNKEIKPYYEIALRYEVDFEIFNLMTEYGSIHGVPVEVIDKMRNNFKPISTKEYIVHYHATKDGNFTKQLVPDRTVKIHHLI
jgi:tRNA uridine 5-carbamoylmethylation protein Kti12